MGYSEEDLASTFAANVAAVRRGGPPSWVEAARDIKQISQDLRKGVDVRKTLAFIAECMKVTPDPESQEIWVELASKDGFSIDARITANARKDITSFLSHDPLLDLTPGALLAVGSLVKFNNNQAGYYLDVSRMGRISLANAGFHHLIRQATRDRLLDKYREHPRIHERLIQETRCHTTDGWKVGTVLEKSCGRLERLILIRPKKTETDFEFKEQLRRADVNFIDCPVVFTSENLVACLKKIPPSTGTIAAIYRGGGSRISLSVFDSYEVAAAIGDCAVPVLTGVGHGTDETLSDRVAYASASTPTGLGKLIAHAANAQAQGARTQRVKTPLASSTVGSVPASPGDARSLEHENQALEPEGGRIAAGRGQTPELTALVTQLREAAETKERLTASLAQETQQRTLAVQARARDAHLAASVRVSAHTRFWTAITTAVLVVAAGFAMTQLSNGRIPAGITWSVITGLMAGWTWWIQSRCKRALETHPPERWSPPSDLSDDWFSEAHQIGSPSAFKRFFANHEEHPRSEVPSS